MREQWQTALRVLPDYLSQHVFLSAMALVLGVLISVPLAVLAARNDRLRGPVLAIAGLIQTIPGLALLALFYPVLLALSVPARLVFGISFNALGFLPCLLALTLYAILPIVRNGVTGLKGIDPSLTEAADGVGMTPREKLWRVELPLAAPVIMAGIRTAAVWTIGAATLSTSIGQTSLGNYIFSGLQTENWVSVLFGCLAASALALTVDQLLGAIESGIVLRARRRIWLGLAGLGLGTMLAAVPMLASGPKPLIIGAKNFSEQFILAEVLAGRLEREGAVVTRKLSLGSAIVFRALANSEIDAYVDYSGTLWTNVMGRTDSPGRADLLRELTVWMRQRYGIGVLGTLGFENAYVLAMPAEKAKAASISTIADLRAFAPRLVLGSDLEFLGRPEWAALKSAYGLQFRDQKSFSPTFMYRAIEDGSVDVISAFSSDGRIAALNLTVLSDPDHVSPAYDAVILVAPKRVADPRVNRALAPLIGKITVERMRQANLMVDRDTGKVSPAQAATTLMEGLD